jgi:hypothetical protein
MIRKLLCAMGLHQPIMYKSIHYESSTETEYIYGCGRLECTWPK